MKGEMQLLRFFDQKTLGPPIAAAAHFVEHVKYDDGGGDDDDDD